MDSTFAYEARQSASFVINSLKLLINCCTCVRASPVSCAAAGNCVSSLSDVARGGQVLLRQILVAVDVAEPGPARSARA